MQMIKGGSSHKIGTEFGTRRPVWQPGFQDRLVRDESEYHNFEKYINENPLKRRLAERSEFYPWSSANGQFPLDPSHFDRLQGLKPNDSSNAIVAALAATLNHHQPRGALAPEGGNHGE
jgi:hypothetical protein